MSTPPRELIMIGQHASGKTTLGRLLARALDASFDDEIGRRLREERLAADPTCDAMASAAGFDDEVFRREQARDDAARPPANAQGIWRIVETWHPGNLSYALARTAHTTTPFIALAHDAITCRPAPPIILPLRIRADTARRRMSEPAEDPAAMHEFLSAIARDTERWCQQWRLDVLPPLWTDERSVAQTLRAALARIQRLCINTSSTR